MSENGWWKSHAHACASCYCSAGVTRRSRGCRRSGVAEQCRIDHLDGEREACSLTSDRVCLPTASKLWGSRDESAGSGVRSGRGAKAEPGTSASAAAPGNTSRRGRDRLARVRAFDRAGRWESPAGGSPAERTTSDGRAAVPPGGSAGAGGRCRAPRTLRLARGVRGRRGPVRSAGAVRSARTVTRALRARDVAPDHRAAARGARRERGRRDDLRGPDRGASPRKRNRGGVPGEPHAAGRSAGRGAGAGAPARRTHPHRRGGAPRGSGNLRSAGRGSR